MSSLPNSWTIYDGRKWPSDSNVTTLDDVSTAAIASHPNGVVTMKFILLLVCDYGRLQAIDSVRYPPVDDPKIVAAPAYVYNAGDDDIIAIMPVDKWKSGRAIGDTLRSIANNTDSRFHAIVNTSTPGWLVDYSQHAMTAKITTGQVAIEVARDDMD